MQDIVTDTYGGRLLLSFFIPFAIEAGLLAFDSLLKYRAIFMEFVCIVLVFVFLIILLPISSVCDFHDCLNFVLYFLHLVICLSE